jgi:hypothetical protein
LLVETYINCTALFDRLVAKGKNNTPEAIISLANKLLKQVFGVVRTGTLFNRK